jgi:hypothetical protein
MHGRDRLMDVPAVMRWLQFLPVGCRPKVMHQPLLEHGGMLLRPDWSESIVSGILHFSGSEEARGRDD